MPRCVRPEERASAQARIALLSDSRYETTLRGLRNLAKLRGVGLPKTEVVFFREEDGTIPLD
jgi:hypothetical protein